MIQPLRAAHRRVFIAMALVLPAILVVGLAARRPGLSGNANAPEGLATASLVRESGGLWERNPIQSKFYSKPDHPQDVYVVLQPAREFNEPDLLLYWAAHKAQADSLPVGARLMGAFATGNPFLLPLDDKRAGRLILFSTAHQAVVDTAEVEKLP